MGRSSLAFWIWAPRDRWLVCTGPTPIYFETSPTLPVGITTTLCPFPAVNMLVKLCSLSFLLSSRLPDIGVRLSFAHLPFVREGTSASVFEVSDQFSFTVTPHHREQALALVRPSSILKFPLPLHSILLRLILPTTQPETPAR
jgi:hypothetical protein